ncbi:hypothetical protein [Streptomyces sp. NPDC004629]
MTGQDRTTAIETDTGSPHPARAYDRYRGGKDHHTAAEWGYRPRP